MPAILAKGGIDLRPHIGLRPKFEGRGPIGLANGQIKAISMQQINNVFITQPCLLFKFYIDN